MTFSQSLRTWRQARRFSQLDLALEADVSARHISFLETGRARPSRDMIGRLGEALQLPLDARNQMLNHAGFAPRYPMRHWTDAEMAPIREAVDHMLVRHAPFPALAIDRIWTVERMNGPASTLFSLLGVGEGDSLLDLMMSDQLPDLVENWPAVAHHVAQRLRTESVAQGGVAELDAAVARLADVPQPDAVTALPVVPVILNTGTLRISMFSTIAQFGTPEDVLLDNLRIELYFPADGESADALHQLVA